MAIPLVSRIFYAAALALGVYLIMNLEEFDRPLVISFDDNLNLFRDSIESNMATTVTKVTEVSEVKDDVQIEETKETILPPPVKEDPIIDESNELTTSTTASVQEKENIPIETEQVPETTDTKLEESNNFVLEVINLFFSYINVLVV